MVKKLQQADKFGYLSKFFTKDRKMNGETGRKVADRLQSLARSKRVFEKLNGAMQKTVFLSNIICGNKS